MGGGEGEKSRVREGKEASEELDKGVKCEKLAKGRGEI